MVVVSKENWVCYHIDVAYPFPTGLVVYEEENIEHHMDLNCEIERILSFLWRKTRSCLFTTFNLFFSDELENIPGFTIGGILAI